MPEGINGSSNAGSVNWFIGQPTGPQVEDENEKLKKISVWDFAQSMQANATLH